MKKIITLLLCVVMLAAGVNAAFEKVNTYSNNFSDVTEQNWFYENVKTSYELGFMNGKEAGKFDPSGNVTIVEGITMAARLHAAYYGVEIKDREVNQTEIRFDFDDDSLVDTTGGKNARQQVGITFGRCIGVFDGGILTVQTDAPNAGGAFDPQIGFNKFNIDSRDFDTITVRMRVAERLPEVVEGTPEKSLVQFYFATSTSPGYDNKKYIGATFNKETEEEWFDIVLDMSKNANWKDIITNFRFDPPENNGIYELDYLVLSKNQENKTAKWYDKYVDYAIKNNIMDDSQYFVDDYNNNITRAQLCELIARAIPEEEFTTINDVKGIPDVLRDSKNSDVYIKLYKAGIVLGDTDGKFNAESDIKRSEVAAIINRVALPENRVKGNVDADWEAQGNEYDIEFNDESWLERLSFMSNGTSIEDGALVFQALDKGEGKPSRFDSRLVYSDIKLNAAENTKFRVRFKAELDETTEGIGNTLFDFYFATDEDPTFTETKAIHADMIKTSYKDAFGWYILEVDLATKAQWKGNITSYRFDPTNANGLFVIDYIRFVKADPLLDATHETLLGMGYKAETLFRDPDFERGFYVSINDNSLGKRAEDHGKFVYYETDEAPAWEIGPYFTRLDLWTDRDTTTDKYTLTDKEGISTVKYDPEQKSITLRLNGAQNYLGKPHIDGEYSWWPHLLLNQGQGVLTGEERKKNGADADRVFMDIDVRVLDFKHNPVKEGHHSLTFPIFFYLRCDDAPGSFIYFGAGGIIHNNHNPSLNPAWTTDSAAHRYIYGTPMADLYNGMENSYNPDHGVFLSGEEWKHLRIDLTPHLDRCIEWANRDNAYNVKVSKDNLYFAGANIGFEIFGNYDATVEFKNFNMTFYRKGE